MRIVGGRFRGTRLLAPKDRTIRPTSDRVREALFNILASPAYRRDDGVLPTGGTVLDVFAGTGALGFEALSRGAARAVFIEQDREACSMIRANADKLGVRDQVRVRCSDACSLGPAQLSAELAFLDPPYGAGLAGPALTALAAGGWLAPAAIVVVELGAKEDFDPPAGFAAQDQRRYGAAQTVLLRYIGDNTERREI